MTEQFYKVQQHPDKWADARKTCHAVVHMGPWQHAHMMIGGVAIRGRKSWNANDPRWENEVVYYNLAAFPLRTILSSIVVHHTNNSESIFVAEYQQQKRGYAALGYHFFIDKTGIVYEGRPLEILGSHAGEGRHSGPLNDPDWGAIGIVLQGDYHHADDFLFKSKAPVTQLAKLEALIRSLRNDYGISQLLLHREVSRSGAVTVCPGDHLAAQVTKLRDSLKMNGP